MSEIEIVFPVQESPEGGYEARALGHTIFTQAEMRKESKTAAQDASGEGGRFALWLPLQRTKGV